MRRDAIVIGAGPAGATAALMLARAGWSVALIEKSGFPRRKVCGEFISATSLPLLDELGLLDEFLQQAGPEVRRVGLFADDAVLDAPMPRPDHASGVWGRALGREHLDLLILQAAQRAGAQVWQPWTASGLRRTADGHVCTIGAASDEREIAAPVVIAAHGSWLSNTLPTGISAPHAPSDLLAFKAHFRDCDLAPDLMPLLAFRGGYGGMVHSDGGRVSLSCCIRRDMLAACRRRHTTHRAADAVLHHIRASCAGADAILRDAVLDDAWLSAGPIRPGIRECWSNGIFLAGNCAGEAHPIVAEGISMAMQSAALLCRHLIAHRPDALTAGELERIGTAYAGEWRSLFAPRIRAAALFAQLAMSRRTAKRALPVVKRFPRLLTFGAHLAGKANRMPALS